MGILHLVQGILMIILGIVNEKFREFSFEITTSYRIFEETSPDQFNVYTNLETYKEVSFLGIFVGTFLLLSAIAHLLIAGPLFDSYVKNLKENMNPYRWYEYALSSSVMIVLIALFFGITNIWMLFLIFMINASMNFFGYAQENVNKYRDEVSWSSYIFGWFAGIAPWVVIFSYLFNANELSKIPDFVYAILIVELLFFMSFAFNMLLQYKKIGPWKNYLYGERMYQILSLVSKTLLAWLVFGGLNQPQDTEFS
jgi:hypothetical protein